jgi:hypothetical protein
VNRQSMDQHADAVREFAAERDLQLDDPIVTRYREVLASRRAEREAEAEHAREQAQKLLTATDPTGHEMLPAEVNVGRNAYIDDDKDPTDWVVRLDYGPFAVTLPARNRRAAEAMAWAFIAALPGVEYDLTALDA